MRTAPGTWSSVHTGCFLRFEGTSPWPLMSDLECLRRSMRHGTRGAQPPQQCVRQRAAGRANALRDVLPRAQMNNCSLTHRCGSDLESLLQGTGSLRHLALQWNQLCSAAPHVARGIEGNACIQRLELSWNGFSDAGCAGILGSVAGNGTLEHLTLAACGAGFASCFVMSRLLHENTTLRHLSLQHSHLTQQVRRLLQSLQTLILASAWYAGKQQTGRPSLAVPARLSQRQMRAQGLRTLLKALKASAGTSVLQLNLLGCAFAQISPPSSTTLDDAGTPGACLRF